MSNLTTLARPYAKAAFELARGDDNLAGWDELLAATAQVTGDETMARWLAGPDASASRAIEIIESVIGPDVDSRFRGYLGVLAANDRLPLAGEIAALYKQLRAEAEKRMDVRVVSAVPLDEAQAERMKAALARRFEREISLHNEIDPEVLGGAVIYAGDQVIDGSLKGRLNRLQASLV
jgi:F-type H+-transporting ATPase subunit delta